MGEVEGSMEHGEDAQRRGGPGQHGERPAAPEQGEHGFEEGLETAPGTPEDEAEGRFSTGMERTGETAEKERVERFSEGQEDLPETEDKNVERRFSEGQERGGAPA